MSGPSVGSTPTNNAPYRSPAVVTAEAALAWNQGVPLSEIEVVAEALATEVLRLTERLDVEEIAHEHTIQQRDDAQEAADRLAYAIAPQAWIGEHTSEVSPWDRAYEVTGEWAAEGLTLAETCKRQTERLAAVEALCEEQERAWNAGRVPIMYAAQVRAALRGTS